MTSFFLNRVAYRFFKSLLVRNIKSIKNFYFKKSFISILYKFIYYLKVPILKRLKYIYI